MVMLPPAKIKSAAVSGAPSTTMAESFDPYRKWLGIAPKDQPPHHYRLLGIPTFESDADVIENAAARQMAHVRTFQGSKHAAISQRLLTELSAAKVCLLTSERKAAYDGQLRARLLAEGKLSSDSVISLKLPPMAVPPPPTPPRRGEERWRTEEPAAPAVAELPPVPIPMPPAPVAGQPLLSKLRRNAPALVRARRKTSAVPLLVTIISALVLIVGGGIAVAVVVNRLSDEAAASGQPPGRPAPSASLGTE